MNKQSTPAAREPLVPLPFTREQIREDVCNIFLFEARKSAHLYGALQAAPYPAFLNGMEFHEWFDQDHGPKDLEITFDKVSNYDLAMAMEDFFDYGFYAVSFNRVEPMEYETIYTWICYYIQDSTKSAYFQEWESYGATVLDSFKRCLYVCELANARCILEEKESLAYLIGSKDEEGNYDGLSIRYLAMLAGMEELSLRSAISRKTAPSLEIKKEDRRTYIEAEVAKNWLTAKGRYQPVQQGRRSEELDLATTRFESDLQIRLMLADRLKFMCDKSEDPKAFDATVMAALKEYGSEYFLLMTHENLRDAALMDKIAFHLDLPADLLKIRAKEAVLKSQITRCELELKQMQKS